MTNPVVIDTTQGASYVDTTREFDAPVEAVFNAHVDPAIFVQWIGPRNLTTTVTHWDFRGGGGYAFEQAEANGSIYAFRGVLHTVVENGLIIRTFEYLRRPDEVSLNSIRFESLPGGRCRLVDHAVFPSVQALERMLAEGMEVGMSEGYEKLDELLKGGHPS